MPWEPQAFRSHSDANLLWEAGMKPVLLGPGEPVKAMLPMKPYPSIRSAKPLSWYFELILALTKAG